MSWCIVYLASPKDHHIYNDPTQASRLELLQGSLRIARKVFPTIDILVFHEDYGKEEFSLLPEVTKFIQVDFSGYEDRCNPNLRRPYGYLMMCRFFSGIMQTHRELANYSHYMRLDDDSYFIQPYMTEHFVNKFLLSHDYVYRSLFHDAKDQQSLFDFTIEFLRTKGYTPHIESLKNELRKKHILSDQVYTGLAPYNNFHLSSLRLWRHSLIREYIQAIEESNGIFANGWMDANIHSMVVFVLSMFIGMTSYHEASFGYRHNCHISLMNSFGIVYSDSLPFTAE
jgi:hypothetical protein